MLTLIEQIKQGQLWDFSGGIHPPENKTLSNQSAISKAEIPELIVLPLKQHIGQKGDILVKVGESVLKGQPLTQASLALVVPIHAPTSGEIIAIENRTIAHPSGLNDLCIVIKPDFKDTWIEKSPCTDYQSLTPEELINKVREAGISGMGGAGFPTSRKLQSGLAQTEVLIINAAECEPYITADDRLMQEYAHEIITGLQIAQHILKPKLTVIGIEDNKPEAIKALEAASQDHDIVIRVIPTKYPSGGEKQLIKIITGKEVPFQKIPADIGLMVQNIGTIYAMKKAIIDDEPLIERVVTLTGKTFKNPGNAWVLLGTPVKALLEQYHYKAERKNARLILGGPMMGFTLPHADVPITKTSNCILAPTKKEIAPAQHEMACIRCSACAEACPVSLLPQQLQWYAKDEDYDKCEEYNLADCIECGACAYVCPSEIPLVQYYRQAKSEIRARKTEAMNAERAKQRFEEKNARLERDKQERENRFKKAADNRRQDMKTSDGDDAVAAAIARVKAQKATQDKKTEEPAKKPAVAAAIARAKAKQAAAAQAGQTEPDNSEMAKLREERKRLAREKKAAKEQESSNNADSSNARSSEKVEKKDAVAAAIARAKARKVAQQESGAEPSTAADSSSTASTDKDPKKAAVAAAIARANARKAAQQTEDSEKVDVAEEAPAEADPKKAAVAAAITRAKARKAAQQTEDSKKVDVAEEAPAEADPKKAAVAAAIARAKARKAAQKAENSEESGPNQVEETEPSAKPTPTEDAPAETDPKKAAVAAAIARAKARKAAQQAENSEGSDSNEIKETEPSAEALSPEDIPSEETPAEADPKKAAVAAAIARAKARKAAQLNNKEN